MLMKYFLYRHIRLDKYQPFYIGIGTKRNSKSFINQYYRAFTKNSRNIIWKNITNKTNYKVEILYESNNYDIIKEKEQYFINIYGRLNNKTGILSNLTKGGDGVKEYIPSEYARIKSKERMIKMNKTRKYFKKPYQSKQVINIETGIFYNSVREAFNSQTVYSESHIALMLRGLSKNKTSFLNVL